MVETFLVAVISEAGTGEEVPSRILPLNPHWGEELRPRVT